MKKPNRVKAALREGRKAYGYNLIFPSPWVVEILGILDFAISAICLFQLSSNSFDKSFVFPDSREILFDEFLRL